MAILTQVIGGLLGLGYVIFMVLSWFEKPKVDSSAGHENLAADNPAQIGVLVGLTGGTIADAATAQSALVRFEQTHGRKPTMQDAGVVVGLMNSLKTE